MVSLGERQYRDCLKLIKILQENGHQTRFAGGCVRDRLLGVMPSDYDLGTTAKPEVVSQILQAARIKVIPTGIQHGTVTAITKSGPVEITTLRKDLAHDGRRATVDFVDDFREDAARRDFTINAMFEDAEGNIYDYFQGQEHLKAGELHFVGDPAQRINEDYLRILRYFRFSARFSFKTDQATLAAIGALTSGLRRISQERITAEWKKILVADQVSTTILLMIQTEVYHTVFPELAKPSGTELPTLDQLAIINEAHRFVARQSALLLDQGHPLGQQKVELFCQRLRVSRHEQSAVEFLANWPSSFPTRTSEHASAMDVIDSVEHACGRGTWNELALPFVKVLSDRFPKPVVAWLDRVKLTKDHIRLQVLPVDGRMLMADLGLAPGKELGEILAELKRDFRNEKWTTPAEGLSRARLMTKKADLSE